MNEINTKENQMEEENYNSSNSLTLKEKFLSKKKTKTNSFNKKLFFGFLILTSLVFFILSNFSFPEITSHIEQKQNIIEDISNFYYYIDNVTHKKVKLSYTLTQNKNNNQTVLLCHGLFGSKNSKVILDLLDGLKDYYSVIRFDFEGNGNSSGEWSYADYPRDIRNIGRITNFIEQVYNLNIVAIIGHSKAGTDILMAAAEPGLIPNKECCFINVAGRLTYGLPEKRFTKEEISKARSEGFIIWKGENKEWKITKEALDERKNMEPKKMMKNIDSYRAQRMLHVHGTKDTSTPIEEANVIKKEIPGIEIKWVQDAGHLFKGKEKELVNTILDWLKIKIK